MALGVPRPEHRPFRYRKTILCESRVSPKTPFNLIDNGLMKESIEGHAVLEDVEEDTFIGFCEFAYLVPYKSPQRSERTHDANLRNSAEREGEQEVLRDEPETAVDDGHSQDIEAEPVLESEPVFEPKPVEPEDAAVQEWDAYMGNQHKYSIFRSDFTYKTTTNKPVVTYVQYLYDGLWELFRQLWFAGKEASPSTILDLVSYRKLYVFATRYLIDSLWPQSLASLHRDLCELSLNKRNIPHVLDLLKYAYQESGRGEPEGGSSLRNLVIHYAACEA